ncbi:MAG: class I SAM-dependent methyltransferase [Candidatus Parcubacteria bacterium]|nr:class I SAM-dependent methyltransferase [Burkholderiales bacterium]
MKRYLKSLYVSLISHDFELQELLRRVESCCADPEAQVLDLGCGHGRLLRPLTERGRKVTGVDENESIVASNRQSGLNCLSTAEFARSEAMFDVIVMSHLVEHFAPEALLGFMDRQLDRLRPGGSLVIATPLSSPYFYDDLDHVRPYPPGSIQMVFAPGVPQTRFRPRNRLVLRDLWFRRAHFRPVSFRGRQMKSWTTMPLAAIESASAIAFHLSFGLIGRTDGWIGVFEKNPG